MTLFSFVFQKNSTISIRGAAAMLIVASHVMSIFFGRIMTPLGGIGVAIFLLLSGYGLNESYKRNGLLQFWTRRLTRLAVPYWLLQCFCLVFVSVPLSVFLLDVCFVVSEYWYIEYIVRIYILYWLFTHFTPRYRLSLLFLTSTLSLFLLPEIQAEQALSFPVGIVFSEYRARLDIISRRNYIVFALFAFTLALTCLAIKQLPIVRELQNTVVYNLIQLGIKLPGALGIIGFAVAYGKPISSKLLYLCGLMAFELYLIHMKFLPYMHSVVTAVCYMGIASLLAYIFYYINNLIFKRITTSKV